MRSPRPPYLLCAEMIVLFTGMLLIDHLVGNGDGFQSIEPNPFWIPVLVFSLAYGTGMGLLASAVASGLWIMSPHIWPGDSDNLDQQLHLSILPMLWFIAALIVGEVTARRVARREHLAGRIQEMEERWTQLGDVVSKLSQTNRDLQVRIATEQRCIDAAIGAALELSMPSPARQTAAIQKLIGLAANSDAFTYYAVRNQQLVAQLASVSNSPSPLNIMGTPLGRAMLEQPRLLHAGRSADREILAELGLIAVPVFTREDRFTGFLLVHSAKEPSLTDARAGELSRVINLLVSSQKQIFDPHRYPVDAWVESRVVA